MTQLRKLAGDLPEVIGLASEHMKKLANSNVALHQENAGLKHELSAYKLARRMEQRGLSAELDFEAKVAKLLEMPVAKLASMDAAVEFATGGFRLGTLEQDDKTASNGDTASSTGGSDPLDSYISSNAAFT